jgi:hypothetical protein
MVSLLFAFFRLKLAVSSHFVARSSDFEAVGCNFKHIPSQPVANFIVDLSTPKE